MIFSEGEIRLSGFNSVLTVSLSCSFLTANRQCISDNRERICTSVNPLIKKILILVKKDIMKKHLAQHKGTFKVHKMPC